MLECPRYGGRLRLIALIDEAAVIERILRHLHLPTEIPASLPARAPSLSFERRTPRHSRGEIGVRLQQGARAAGDPYGGRRTWALPVAGHDHFERLDLGDRGPAMTESDRSSVAQSPSRRFPTTRWSVVSAAGGTPSSEARDALEGLCTMYWPPVYAFIRRSGRSADAASDLTQAFFARVIEKGDLGHARRERGRFRTFLLTAVRHFLANQADFERAAKRGGGRQHVPLAPTARVDPGGAVDPASDETPETTFEHQWALTVLDASMARLEYESTTGGDELLFVTLRPFLTGDGGASYADAAVVLQRAEGTVRVAVHRLRRRFGQCLRETLADNVNDPADVDAELAYLLDVLSRRYRTSPFEQP